MSVRGHPDLSEHQGVYGSIRDYDEEGKVFPSVCFKPLKIGVYGSVLMQMVLL